MTAETNEFPLEAFADCFQKFLSHSTNILKLAEIILNRNKTTLYFLVFFNSIFTPDLELYWENFYMNIWLQFCR
jgi:hypothetical protein